MYGAPPPPPRRSGPPIAVIVLLVVVGVVALAFVAGGVVAYRSIRSLRKDPVWEESSRALEAPGTQPMREAGCNTRAAVIDVDSMPELVGLYRSFPGRADQPVDVKTIVDCGWIEFDRPAPPSCDSVKRAWLGAIGGHARGPFRVAVEGSNHQIVCNEKFDADGRP